MPINQKGFSPLLILIVATVVLIVIGGGAYFFQSNQFRNPSAVTPVSSVSPSRTSVTTLDEVTASATPIPTPNSQPLTFTGVTQQTCTSSSCGNTTVITVTGSGFSGLTQLSATGQTNGNPYTGTVSQVNNDGTQIYFDLLNLPCQTYVTTLTNPTPSKNSVTFNFYPNKC